MIAGAGSYTVGGEFAVQQRMEAELVVADEPPAPFDSGLVVGGGGFPDQIDVEISKNGKVCFDTVMHVVAADRSRFPSRGRPRSCSPAGGVLAIAVARARRQRI